MRTALRRLCCMLICLAASALAASPALDIRAYRVAHEAVILDELVELLKIPNLASDGICGIALRSTAPY
jgi:hypothetical protein